MKRIITLGRACRPTYQARLFSSKNGLEIVSTPFDWTVTPYLSIARILDDDFSPLKVLDPCTSFVTPNSGSITCGYSGINFHHDLSPKIVKHYHSSHDHPVAIVPASIIDSPEWQNAKGRFEHTFSNFSDSIRKSGNLFVRWRRKCHAGDAYSQAETDWGICRLLQRKKGVSQDFRLLIIETHQINTSQPIVEPLQVKSCDDVVLCCKLKERKGHNGDLTGSWKGDESSWDICFRYAQKVLFESSWEFDAK